MNDEYPELSGCPAEGPGCNVRLCEMGVVHVTLGGMTVHISQPTFETLCDTLVGALCQLVIRRGCQSKNIPKLI